MTKQVTHTQGEWIVNDGIRNQLYVEVTGGGFICDMQLDATETGKGQVLSDARLIAAAPELLEALKELYKQCAMIHMYGGDASNSKEGALAIQRGLDVIAKAEGRAS